jgi:hypothetical protein
MHYREQGEANLHIIRLQCVCLREAFKGTFQIQNALKVHCLEEQFASGDMPFAAHAPCGIGKKSGARYDHACDCLARREAAHSQGTLVMK